VSWKYAYVKISSQQVLGMMVDCIVPDWHWIQPIGREWNVGETCLWEQKILWDIMILTWCGTPSQRKLKMAY